MKDGCLTQEQFDSARPSGASHQLRLHGRGEPRAASLVEASVEAESLICVSVFEFFEDLQKCFTWPTMEGSPSAGLILLNMLPKLRELCGQGQVSGGIPLTKLGAGILCPVLSVQVLVEKHLCR